MCHVCRCGARRSRNAISAQLAASDGPRARACVHATPSHRRSRYARRGWKNRTDRRAEERSRACEAGRTASRLEQASTAHTHEPSSNSADAAIDGRRLRHAALASATNRAVLLQYAMASVDVKLTMEAVTRRVTLPAHPPPTWAALSALAASRFGLSGVRGLSYVDGDGDSIILSVHVDPHRALRRPGPPTPSWPSSGRGPRRSRRPTRCRRCASP